MLKPARTRETVESQHRRTSAENERIGRREFTVNGRQLGLSAFAEPGSGKLFVPFRDETSRSQTYPGGRYLDLEPTPTGLYEVDFNLAYHVLLLQFRLRMPYPPPEIDSPSPSSR